MRQPGRRRRLRLRPVRARSERPLSFLKTKGSVQCDACCKCWRRPDIRRSPLGSGRSAYAHRRALPANLRSKLRPPRPSQELRMAARCRQVLSDQQPANGPIKRGIRELLGDTMQRERSFVVGFEESDVAEVGEDRSLAAAVADVASGMERALQEALRALVIARDVIGRARSAQRKATRRCRRLGPAATPKRGSTLAVPRRCRRSLDARPRDSRAHRLQILVLPAGICSRM